MEPITAAIVYVDSDTGRSYTVRIVPENLVSDDGRVMVAPVGWRDGRLPFTFSDVEGEPHEEARHVGNLFNLRKENVDGTSWVTADLDWDTDDLAIEAKRLVDEDRITKVSMHATAGVGYVLCAMPESFDRDSILAAAEKFDPEACPDDNLWVQAWLDIEIGAATLLLLPAFEDAQVISAGGRGAAEDDESWDAGEAMRKAGAADDPAAAYRAIAIETTTGEPSERQHWALPHHREPGAPANAAAIRNARARFDQTENLKDKAAARNHLYEVHKLPSELESAIAASVDLAKPPKGWFTVDLTGPTPLSISDDGWVYGHLALWDTCHRGFENQCITPPRNFTEYAQFHENAKLTTAEGETLGVGCLTFDVSHADLRSSASAAKRHYDHTGTVFAFVRAGEDDFGVWVAGAIRPDLDSSKVETLRRLSLSGDWRPKDGEYHLIAAQAVPVPGFPVKSLVAAGVQVEFNTVGPTNIPPDPLEELSDTALVAAVVQRLVEEVQGLRETFEAERNLREYEEALAVLHR